MQHSPIIVLGCGPAGMATALALIKAGHQVVVYERYSQSCPAGNILDLWAPPIKALKDMGVNVQDIGTPCHTIFKSINNNVRAIPNFPEDVVKEYGGGFFGLLRPDLYTRMLDAIPQGTIRWNKTVSKIEDRGQSVFVTFEDGETVETPLLICADGIDSFVRQHLWGPNHKRAHNLHLIGGYTFDRSVNAPDCLVAVCHSPTVQGTYSSILSQGRKGHQWWTLEAWPDDKEGP